MIKVGALLVGLSVIKKNNIIDIYKLNSISTGFILKRVIKNGSSKIKKINDIKIVLNKIDFNKDKIKDYYYSNENARLFCNLTIPLDYNRMNDNDEKNERYDLSIERKWNDPGVQQGPICSSPYQPFPAILVSNYDSKDGIVVGSLSQDVFCHTFNVGHNDKGAFIEIYSLFKDIEYREIKPGEELIDLIYIGYTNRADDFNHIFDGYVEVLSEYLKDNIGKSNTNRHTLIWDSWNDGIYRDVSEDMLLKEAKALKKYFKNIEWFQLDDGYSTYCEKNVDLDAHGMGVPYEGEEGIDSKKFPNGLKHYTDEIKKIGFKPAVWIGGLCPIKSKIYQEKPEWFLDYNYRINFSQPLDISIPKVREYIKYALDVYINKYGFEGVKLDFWSYAFEERHDLLENKDKSGYEYREWILKNMREYVTKNGYIQTGCDLSMGNPFLGKYINNYRFGLDIGSGKFENILTTLFWATTVLSTHTGHLYIPNSDSIGLLPGLNDTDFMFAVNFQIITRTLVEISGRFSRIDKDNPRLKVLMRATKYLNNGEDVYFAKYDYRKKGVNTPEIVYINSAFDEDSKDYITVALFNSSENEKKISFTMEDVGLTNKLREVEYVWEEKFVNTNKINGLLLPHGSVLLKIRR